MGRHLLIVLSGVLCVALAEPAFAATHANPATWTVEGPNGGGRLFILSSVHALPDGDTWSNGAIDAAAARADTYVFETATDDSSIADTSRYIVDHGFLPEGQSLTERLSASARKDYLAACATAGMQPKVLDNKRLWLAAVLLTTGYMDRRGVTAANTPEDYYNASGPLTGKSVRYLDSNDTQLEFLSRLDDTMGFSGFSAMLGDFAGQPAREDALIAAWSAGDTTRLTTMIDEAFRPDPAGALIFAQHNREWTRSLEDLVKSGHDAFVVVGVAHLVGANGVPNLLRADGYRVEGP
jgi:uncharacterized protein YbaP (TraB family)